MFYILYIECFYKLLAVSFLTIINNDNCIKMVIWKRVAGIPKKDFNELVFQLRIGTPDKDFKERVFPIQERAIVFFLVSLSSTCVSSCKGILMDKSCSRNADKNEGTKY